MAAVTSGARAVDAIGGIVGGLIAGALLGLAGGGVVFAVERVAGWLDAPGWTGALLWALLPLYMIVAGVVLAGLGMLRGLRRAVMVTLIDSGALGRAARRGLDGLAPEARRGEVDDPELPARVRGFGHRVLAAARKQVAATASRDADTVPQIESAARLLVSEWGETAEWIAIIALVLGLAAAPIALAVTGG